MSKLVCSKCGGTLFHSTNMSVVYTVYVPNGSAPYERTYICDKCGNTETVYYPAVYYDAPAPKEIEIPENGRVKEQVKTDPLKLEGTLDISEDGCVEDNSPTWTTRGLLSTNSTSITRSPDSPYFFSKCPICDKDVKVPTMGGSIVVICDDCKEAVKFAKLKLKERK